MQPAYERMKAAYARTAAFMQGRMQPACSLHASLVWTRHKTALLAPILLLLAGLPSNFCIWIGRTYAGGVGILGVGTPGGYFGSYGTPGVSIFGVDLGLL